MLKEWGNELDILSHAKTTYREESKGKAFIQEDAWEVLKKDAKWDASKPIELVDFTGHGELFGDDKRPRLARQTVSRKKNKFETTSSTEKVTRHTNFGM
ncbi:hypothetical protein Tco_1534486 [Tanacetum coccineum]